MVGVPHCLIHKNRWREHVLWIENYSIAKAAYFYGPQGSHNIGKPRKCRKLSWILLIQLKVFVNNINLN